LSLKKLGLQDSSLQDYYSHCHKLGIVPKDLNKLQNKLFGIECNYEELNGIDFKKGCYVGQENTARIKLKNKLSKRLLPINSVQGELTEGESIYHKEKEIGKVLIEKDYPFALIKFRDVNLSENIDFNTKEASLKIEKPDWIKSN
jgi:folate-binding protein YgfZ